jgi:signal transduction histidine kinase
VKRRTSVALVLTAIVGTVLTVVLCATSDVLATPVASAAVRGSTLAAWTLCGLHTWERRPDSPLGAVMTLGGLAYGLGTLNALDAPAAFTIGSVLWVCGAFLVTYVALAFPSGRLSDRLSRTTAVVGVGASAVLWGALLVGAETMPTPARPFHCATDCPSNPFAVVDLGETATDAIAHAAFGLVGAAALVAIAILIRRGRGATPVGRRILLAPIACLCTIAGSFVVALVLDGLIGSDGVGKLAGWVPGATSIAFPFVLLIGQARGRLFAAGSLRDMVSRLSAAPTGRNLEAVMADALGDPSLRLAFPIGRGGFIDGGGEPIPLPDDPTVAVTEVWDDHELMAAILHDPVLDEPAPGVVQAAGGAVLLALENARLEADVRASARALRASRARMLTAGVAERRRLERDLHDTAQQRLVALRIKFSLAREAAPGELDELLEELGADVEATIDSVRVVGRGLYPPLLADRGLGPALRSALSTVPATVSLSVGELGRSDPNVEAAVFLCCRSVGQLLGDRVAAARLALELRERRLWIAIACAPGSAPRDDLTRQVLTSVRDHVGTLGGRVLYANGSERWRIDADVPWPRRA